MYQDLWASIVWHYFKLSSDTQIHMSMLMFIHKKQHHSIVHYQKKQAQTSLMPFHHHLPCVHSSWQAWDCPHQTFEWAELHEQWVWLKVQWSIRLTWLVQRFPTGMARSIWMGVRECKGSHCKFRRGGAQAGQRIGGWRSGGSPCLANAYIIDKPADASQCQDSWMIDRSANTGQSRCVKTLQGLGMLDMSVVLWVQGSVSLMVRWFRWGRKPKLDRGWEGTMNCKNKMKTRLRSNYSYYRILIVEDTQPITYECKQSESWNKSMSHRTASRS